MEKGLDKLDWALVQAFLVVAEEGSLSAAARRLGASQPTLGRQVRAAEAALGLTLFQRHPRGFALTEAGVALVPPARAMAEAMRQIALYAAGHEVGMAGTVRITASDMVSHHVLPPILARLGEEVPDIEIELVPTDASENLLYREADIAVRMYRPEQLDVVAKYLGEIELGVFAARAYIARRGQPAGPAEILEHDLVGYDRSELIVRGMRQAGFEVDRRSFRIRCDSQTAYWELIRAGCGIGFGQAMVARRDPEIVEIDLGLPIPGLPVWLAAHEAVRHTPRVRLVWQRLERELADIVTPVPVAPV